MPVIQARSVRIVGFPMPDWQWLQYLLWHKGTTDPTATNLDCTATPNSLVFESLATIEKVEIGGEDFFQTQLAMEKC